MPGTTISPYTVSGRAFRIPCIAGRCTGETLARPLTWATQRARIGILELTQTTKTIIFSASVNRRMGMGSGHLNQSSWGGRSKMCSGVCGPAAMGNTNTFLQIGSSCCRLNMATLLHWETTPRRPNTRLTPSSTRVRLPQIHCGHRPSSTIDQHTPPLTHAALTHLVPRVSPPALLLPILLFVFLCLFSSKTIRPDRGRQNHMEPDEWSWRGRFLRQRSVRQGLYYRGDAAPRCTYFQNYFQG